MDILEPTLSTGRWHRGSAKLRLLGIVALVLTGTSIRLAAQPTSGSPTEWDVKAAFVYNFAKFVDWPGEFQADSNDRIVVGVFAKDPFGAVLERSFQAKSINGRLLIIKRINHIKEARSCHILFIGSSEKHRFSEILEVLKNASVLTIGDMSQFAEKGGVIYLKMDANRVRFEINVAAATRAKLKISSKLLQLASAIREKD